MSKVDSNDTVTVINYPKGKVIGIYGLLGGAIGGLILISYIIVITIVKESISVNDALDFIKILAAGAVFGFFSGFVTSIFNGLLCI